MARLTGKVAIVTGAASGIGEAIVHRFAAEGAQVVATDILDGSRVAAESGADFAQHDVANGGDWKRVMDHVADRYGRLDVLVNNAGIVSGQSIDETQLETWNRVFAVNVTGVMLGTRFAIEQMRANPDESGGSIINLAPATSFAGFGADAAYTASKHALVGLTRSAAAHAAQEGWGIRINSLHPGPTDTALFRRQVEAQPALLDAFKTMSPRGRLARPEEVAGLALHLASDDSAFSTGAQFTVDGGLSSTHPSL